MMRLSNANLTAAIEERRKIWELIATDSRPCTMRDIGGMQRGRVEDLSNRRRELTRSIVAELKARGGEWRGYKVTADKTSFYEVAAMEAVK